MIPGFLGIDAGGTSTRAVLVLADGTCVAQSRRAGGNPTSRGIDGALRSIVSAAREATATAARAMDQEIDIQDCLLAMAGERDKIDAAVLGQELGLHPEKIHLVSDVAGMYFSSACDDEGAVVIAGTGSVAARISGGLLTEVAGGAGWLLGDGGSGFWIGQKVVQAVASDLSGLSAPTALTASVLQALGHLDPDAGRVEQLAHLVRATYASPPVHLSQFAPIAFELAPKDASARQILEGAGEHLAGLIERFPVDGPLVLGGSVMTQGFLSHPESSRALAAALDGRDLRLAENGSAGAAFLALRQSGLGDRTTHERIRATSGGHQMENCI